MKMSDYKFLPDDATLLCYLKAKINKEILESKPIMDCPIYDFVPWKLPGLENVKDKTTEQYYFVPRERKTKNSSRPNRIVKGKRGAWKINGNGKDILDEEKMPIGHKQGLVFMSGNDEKTPWLMHEYTLPSIFDQNKKMQFQELVLCRIRKSGHSKCFEEDEIVNHLEERDGKRQKRFDEANKFEPPKEQQQHHSDDQGHIKSNVTSVEYFDDEDCLNLELESIFQNSNYYNFLGRSESITLDHYMGLF